MNINKLKENEYIKFVPQANTSPWEIELDKDKKPYFPFVESQAYIDIHIDILLCDYDSDEDYIEKMEVPQPAPVQSRTVTCKCCGAKNIIQVRNAECEYCGSQL